jgi:hypothetical protein
VETVVELGEPASHLGPASGEGVGGGTGPSLEERVDALLDLAGEVPDLPGEVLPGAAAVA